ncbi:MAG TPA: TetR/AcrR family transcriptional regulator [Solirubrobacterales bacterium]|nr:TetR/AcrR family transcriptional regulator [Solirubrobacterales bacterium]
MLNGSRNGHDPNRARIALAIVELVGESGLDAVDAQEICRRADVSRAHFDRCFADLEDCFLSLHDEVAAEFWERLGPAAAATAGWHDRIWAAGWAMMRFLHEDPARARFLLVAVNGAGTEGLQRRDRIVQRVADLLEEGPRRHGKAGRRSRATAEIAAGATYRMLLTKVEAGAVDRREEFLPELIYVAVMPYLDSQAAEDQLAVQPLH